jgi:hypothetical protein
MPMFEVEITETLQRVAKVEALTLDEAVDRVRERYKCGEFVLDSGDFADVHIAGFACHVT